MAYQKNRQRNKSFSAGDEILDIISEQTKLSGAESESAWLRSIIRRQRANNTTEVVNVAKHFEIPQEDVAGKAIKMMNYFIAQAERGNTVTIGDTDITGWFIPGEKLSVLFASDHE